MKNDAARMLDIAETSEPSTSVIVWSSALRLEIAGLKRLSRISMQY